MNLEHFPTAELWQNYLIDMVTVFSWQLDSIAIHISYCKEHMS